MTTDEGEYVGELVEATECSVRNTNSDEGVGEANSFAAAATRL